MLQKWCSYAACTAAALLLAGCGGPGAVKTVPVTGTVTLDGNPVEGATVSFAPQATEGRTAVGVTDSQGKFKLNTAGAGAGAMPGKYNVAISKTTGGAVAAAPTSQEEGMQRAEEQMAGGGFLPKGPVEVKDELPPIYKDPKTSGLTADVGASGTNDFAFPLKSSGGGGGG